MYPSERRADDRALEIASHFEDVQGLHLDPETPGYGLSPLHFAPTPTSRSRKLFTGAQISGALEQLERSQQPDGGWPISWEPPSEAAKLEWRGIVTLEALRPCLPTAASLRSSEYPLALDHPAGSREGRRWIRSRTLSG